MLPVLFLLSYVIQLTDNCLPNIQMAPDKSNQIRFPLDYLHTLLLFYPRLSRTHDNSNLPLALSNSCFHFRSFLCNFTLDNSNCFKRVTSQKQKQFTEVQNTEFILKQPCQFFVCTSVCYSVSIPINYINQALLLFQRDKNSFFNISMYISCSPWSEVCMILCNYWTRLSKISWYASDEQIKYLPKPKTGARHWQITIFCDNRVQ